MENQDGHLKHFPSSSACRNIEIMLQKYPFSSTDVSLPVQDNRCVPKVCVDVVLSVFDDGKVIINMAGGNL
jgi:hypothetical protein